MLVHESLFDPRLGTADGNPRSMDTGGDFRRLVRALQAVRPPPPDLLRDAHQIFAHIAGALPESAANDELSVRQVARRMVDYLVKSPGGLYADDMLTWLRDYPVGAGNDSAESAAWEIEWFTRYYPQIQTALGDTPPSGVREIADLAKRVYAESQKQSPVAALLEALHALPSYRASDVVVSLSIALQEPLGMAFATFRGAADGPHESLGLAYTDAEGQPRIFTLGTDRARGINLTEEARRVIDGSPLLKAALADYREAKWRAVEEERRGGFVPMNPLAAPLDPEFIRCGNGPVPLSLDEEPTARELAQRLRRGAFLPDVGSAAEDLAELGILEAEVVPLASGAPHLELGKVYPGIGRNGGTPAPPNEEQKVLGLVQRSRAVELVRALGLSAKDFLDRILKNPIVISNPAEYGELLLEWAALPGEVNILEAVVIAGGLGYELADLAKYLEGELPLDVMVELLKAQEARRARTAPAR